MTTFARLCGGPVRLHAVGLLAVLAAFGRGPAAQAEEPAALAQIAPESTILYLELQQLESLCQAAADDRWKVLLEGNDDWQTFQKSQQATKLKAALGMVEQRLKMPWHQALGELTSGGVALAADPFERSSLLLVRARNAEILSKVRQLAIDLGELAALASGKPSPLSAEDHRGIEIWSIAGQAAYAIAADARLLIAGNRREAVVAAVDRMLDGGRSLADRPEFRQAQTAGTANSAARGFLRLEKFRSLPQWEKLQAATRSNPGAENLLGGLIEALDRASYLAFDAAVVDGRLKLSWQTPFDRGQVSDARQWYFAPAGQEAAPAVLRPEGTILSVSMYRDHGTMWQQRDALFDEAALAKLAQAGAGLGLFFSNRDFGSQVLGELGPGSRLVVSRQTFAEGEPAPSIKLPAVAAVLELKNPQEFSPVLLAAYQTVIGLVNVDGVQKGRPQLLQQVEQYRGATIYHAAYLQPPGEAPKTMELIYNFRPGCAVVKGHFIVGSTPELVRQLVDELQRADSSRRTASNVHVLLDVEQLTAALADNEQALVTQNMLQKGNTRGEAENEVARLLRVLRQFGVGELRVLPANGKLEISAQVGLPQLD